MSDKWSERAAVTAGILALIALAALAHRGCAGFQEQQKREHEQVMLHIQRGDQQNGWVWIPAQTLEKK